MLKLLLCLVFVVAAVLLLKKGINSTFLFLALGLILAGIVSVMSHGSVAKASSGLVFFDIFEAYKEQLIASFGTVGLSMLPIFGYSAYMNKIGASPVLGRIFSAPVKKAKNPYFVGCLIAILICGIMRIAIVSAFAIMALLFSTLYPAMLQAGLSRKTTISAIFLGTCFDWGPADFVVAQILGGTSMPDLTNYFVSASVIVTPIALIVAALVSGFIMKKFDDKDGYVPGSDIPTTESAATGGEPAWYMILPLLPMILIIVFSKVFFASISISVVTAVCISLIVTFVVELTRKHDLKARLADMGEWISSMGAGFGNLFLFVVSLQFFAKQLANIGGFTYLFELLIDTGISGWLLLFMVGVLVMILAVLTGEPTALTTVLAGQVEVIAAGMGIPLYAALLPVQTANSFRCISIGTGIHIQYCCKQATCEASDILKRCAIPCVIIYLTAFIASRFLLV